RPCNSSSAPAARSWPLPSSSTCPISAAPTASAATVSRCTPCSPSPGTELRCNSGRERPAPAAERGTDERGEAGARKEPSHRDGAPFEGERHRGPKLVQRGGGDVGIEPCGEFPEPPELAGLAQ